MTLLILTSQTPCGRSNTVELEQQLLSYTCSNTTFHLFWERLRFVSKEKSNDTHIHSPPHQPLTSASLQNLEPTYMHLNSTSLTKAHNKSTFKQSFTPYMNY